MLTSVKGIYQNGQIVLSEQAPFSDTTEVIVTFLENKNRKEKQLAKNEIRFGSLKGKVNIPDDFNEPLDDLKEYMDS